MLTREGAADRKNGLVVLDVSTPAHPKILSEFTDSLTSGIHNTWFYQHVVYVTNDGTGAINIIDISDPKAPKMAGGWETGDPNNRTSTPGCPDRHRQRRLPEPRPDKSR